VLGWQPEITFEQLVRDMVEADSELARRDAHMRQQGFKVFDHRE
jgi:GDPmannose 4,6-dehydratase